MMFGKKRPWKKYARILRIEHNNGDVQFHAENEGQKLGYGVVGYTAFGNFENLTDAEKALDAWWADWWPKQVKKTRRA